MDCLVSEAIERDKIKAIQDSKKEKDKKDKKDKKGKKYKI